MKAVIGVAAVFFGLLGVGVSFGSSPNADCTAAQKTQREAAVTAYRLKIPAERKAYFKTHKAARARAAFVRRQQAKLNALLAAAGCTVPAPPLPPAPTAPPATGGFSPSLDKPGFADNSSAVDDPWVGEWGPKTDPYFLPGTGHLRTLLVPIDFSDAPATRPVSFYDAIFRAAPQWFATASYGRLSFDLTTVDHWVRMPRPVASYGVSHCCPAQAIYDLMSDIVRTLDPTVDFSQVDSIYAVGPEASGPNLDILLYRRWPGRGIVADGKELRWGVVGNGNFRSVDTAGLLAEFMEHEIGHLMGLSDLYGRACPTCQDTHELVGTWSLMDTAPPNHDELGWDKWLLGWIDPAQIVGVTAPGTVETTLAPLETPGGNKLVIVPVTGSFLYAVEVRQPLGVDKDLCDKGVLVYTVRADVFNAQGAVHVMQAQPSDPSRASACGPLWSAAFDLGSGEVSTFEDAMVKVEVVSASGPNYVVRVTRK